MEAKELLFKDLSARLPYGVKAQYYGSEEEMLTVDTIEAIYAQPSIEIIIGQYGLEIEDVKPYLRPMSSMTEEEKKELKFMCDIGPETLTDSSWINGEFGLSVVYKNKASICVDVIDWLNKNMFDYRGLIEKGLAIEVTEENNPYK